jgi:hypothetical protein
MVKKKSPFSRTLLLLLVYSPVFNQRNYYGGFLSAEFERLDTHIRLHINRFPAIPMFLPLDSVHIYIVYLLY